MALVPSPGLTLREFAASTGTSVPAARNAYRRAMRTPGALALPQDGQVVSGEAAITTEGNAMQIQTGTPQTVIH